MIKHPIFGVGEKHWGMVAESYGWPPGKEAHSLWFQAAAELGIPGVAFLILFYYRTVMHTWRARRLVEVPWMSTLARIMLVSIAGFAVAASFVTVEGLELPFYIALLGASGLKIAYATALTEYDSSLTNDVSMVSAAPQHGGLVGRVLG